MTKPAHWTSLPSEIREKLIRKFTHKLNTSRYEDNRDVIQTYYLTLSETDLILIMLGI